MGKSVSGQVKKKMIFIENLGVKARVLMEHVV